MILLSVQSGVGTHADLENDIHIPLIFLLFRRIELETAHPRLQIDGRALAGTRS